MNSVVRNFEILSAAQAKRDWHDHTRCVYTLLCMDSQIRGRSAQQRPLFALPSRFDRIFRSAQYYGHARHFTDQIPPQECDTLSQGLCRTLRPRQNLGTLSLC